MKLIYLAPALFALASCAHPPPESARMAAAECRLIPDPNAGAITTRDCRSDLERAMFEREQRVRQEADLHSVKRASRPFN